MASTTANKILVVDDSVDFCLIVHKVLSAAGYEVCALPDGRDVMEYCRNHRPDLVILDIVMPFVEGTELAISLAREFPDLPVIATSSRPDYLTLMSDFGARAVLVKPVEPANLVALVENTLAA